MEKELDKQFKDTVICDYRRKWPTRGGGRLIMHRRTFPSGKGSWKAAEMAPRHGQDMFSVPNSSSKNVVDRDICSARMF